MQPAVADPPVALAHTGRVRLAVLADAVVVLHGTAPWDPAVLADALARRRPGTEVVGLRAPTSSEPGPAGWWGAVLPLDAVRAVGALRAEAGEGALADLVLRAEAAGYRWTALAAAGPVPHVAELDRLRLALLHAPSRARTPLLIEGLAGDGRLLLRLRLDELRARRASLDGLGGGSRVAIWASWRALQRRERRSAVPPVNHGWPRAERDATVGRPPAVRLAAWSTTRRGTSAA